MTPFTRIAVALVTLALICYTIGTAKQQRALSVTRSAIGFLTGGVTLDIVATTFMILGSGKVLTLHGLIGYSALAAMVFEVAIAWRWRVSRGDAPITNAMSLYARLAYGYWVLAFISGGLLVALTHRTART